MKKMVDWAKNHPVTLLLFAVVVVLIARPQFSTFSRQATTMSAIAPMMDVAPQSKMMAEDSYAGIATNFAPVPPYSAERVELSQTDRKVVSSSYLSLLVKNVSQTATQITQYATSVGGFMVDSSVSTPSEGGSGTVSIRVPSEKVAATLEYLRGLSVKVVIENLSGTDVTDQYTDTQARLITLTKTKTTFEAMMDKANTVEEILKVQQSILQVQDQIDMLKGRLQYLENTSKSSLITVYLSTDELALPYSPDQPWRPSVIFKTAVRSLVGNLRVIGNFIIWAVVYSPIIIVAIVVSFIIKRRFLK